MELILKSLKFMACVNEGTIITQETLRRELTKQGKILCVSIVFKNRKISGGKIMENIAFEIRCLGNNETLHLTVEEMGGYDHKCSYDR